MANTQGLSDEALESMFGEPSSSKPEVKSRSALERRMELPMGERPAARVIRASGRLGATGQPSMASPAVAAEPEASSSPTTPSAVVGDIVERKSRRRRLKSSIPTDKQSRFRQQSQQTAAPPATGFPSVQVPLGELVKSKQHDNKAALGALVTPSQTTTSSLSTLQEATARDAQAMLAQMSPSEIQEHVQELHAALSPETICFLKKRRGQKVGQQAIISSKNDESNSNRTEEAQQSSSTSTAASPAKQDDDPFEKERLAQVLSSIRTYEDMDAAYAQEKTGDAVRLELGTADDAILDDDFEKACDLLRSSVPRQNLWAARVVCHRLQQDVKAVREERTFSYALGDPKAQQWPYPVLLPVSLRCLLDASVSRVNGLILHTYVLQALHYLLQLRVCVDHVIDVYDMGNSSSHFPTAASLYQEYFLDDAVPTPSLESCYSTSGILQPISANSAVAYATSSSSTSAQEDGDAFCQDPLWTLLSRMRILPRLAQLLQHQHKSDAASWLPPEAITAMCGILSLLAQRSPGAATAIVQHPTLLRDLKKYALVPRDTHHSDPAVALPVVLLSCTLARQSRTAAQGLEDIPSSLLPDLVQSNESAYRLQKWTLVLWRTCLRYGLSLEPLQTMLTLAASHCSLGPDQESLAPFFYSSFTVIVHAIRALQASEDEQKKTQLVKPDDIALLSQAGVWLSSSKHQAMQLLMDSKNHPILPLLQVDQMYQGLYRLQLYTSVLRYLEAWLTLSRANVEKENGEFKTEEMTESEEEQCLEAILSFLRSSEIKMALQVALRYRFQTDLSFLPIPSANELSLEAGSCAFADSLLLLATSIALSYTPEQVQSSLISSVRAVLIESIESLPTMESVAHGATSESSHIAEKSRRFWLNRTHASLVRFLASSTVESIDDMTQSLGLTVIGRLERGEESTAALLFSCDNLLRRHSKAPSLDPSPISSFFVRELCLTQRAKSQLDHSFKLRNAIGISSDKLGPFQLQSLWSEADSTGPLNSSRDDLLLPMGDLWLWKTFAGSVVDQNSDAEAIQVVLTTLQLVCELETTSSARTNYTRVLNLGGRLYYVMNLCLQPGSVLENDQIREYSNRLIDHYTRVMDGDFAFGLAQECEKHSAIKTKETALATSSTEQPTEGNRQVARLLDPSIPSKDKAWPAQVVRAVESFLADLCDAFLDYGAQHAFFTKCLRLFLASSFPSKIRCNLIQRLRDVLHLLTLSEDEDLRSLLKMCLSGGLPSVDRSVRDVPEVLDIAASILGKGQSVRPDSSFITSWATALLARSLAIHLEDGGEGGLLVSKRRIQSLEQPIACRILAATEAFLASKGTLEDLVAVSLGFNKEYREEFLFIGDDESWGRAIALLKEAID